MAAREKNGRWKGGIYVSSKGYPRISAGPFRDRYLPKLIWEWTHPFDPPLEVDEDIDHIDGDKMNFHPSNLRRINKVDHGIKSNSYDDCPF